MKKLIAFIISILLLGALGILGLLLVLDYQKVEQEFISLLGSNATSTVTLDRIEVIKFPVPRLVAHNVEIPGILNADMMVVSFSPMSILKRKPHITTITISQAGLDLEVAVQYEEDKPSYGKTTIKTGHISQFLKDYPDLQLVMINLVPPHATNLIFDLVASDEYLTFANLKLKSAVLDCDGEVALSRNGVSRSKLNLTCNKVQMVDDGLEKVMISGESDKDGLHLTSASGNIVSGGDFAISGNVTKNLYRSLFNGTLRFNHGDINSLLSKLGLSYLSVKESAQTSIAANFKITPVEFLFHDLSGQIGGLKVDGHTDIKFIGITPRVLLKFNVTGFDSTKQYPVISPTVRYLLSLLQDSGDKAYSTKFVPIRNINYLGSYEVNFLSPTINDQLVQSLEITGNVSTGKIDVKSFNYVEEANYLKGRIAIDTMSIKPIFHFNISDGIWNTSNLTLQNLLDANSSLQGSDLSKMQIITDLSLKSLTQEGRKFDNVKLVTNNDGNIINITNCSADHNGGNIQTNGTIALTSPMNVNLGYVYNSVDLSKIANFFGSDIYLSGIANIGGIISTNGASLEELLYKLYIKSKFLATKVTAQGISIDDLVNKLNSLKYDKVQLNEDLKLATSSGTTSIHGLNGSCNMDAGILSLKGVTFGSNYTSGTLEMIYNIYNQEFDFSSLWSFQLPISDTGTSSTSLGISVKKTGDNTLHTIDTDTLLKIFNTRDNQNAAYSLPNTIPPKE